MEIFVGQQGCVSRFSSRYICKECRGRRLFDYRFVGSREAGARKISLSL